jgi:3-hydroxyisobutyrate dehydrogenase-like beta-hydroxyacid dehydrogenase
MKLGFIGLGAMGLPMTRHLIEAGHEVSVASRSRGPIDAAVAAGAIEGDGPRGVVDASEITLVCVPNSPEVIEVVDAALPALGADKVLVDCSTIDPDVERAQHERVTATVPASSRHRSLAAPSAPRTAPSRSWSAATRTRSPRSTRRSSRWRG